MANPIAKTSSRLKGAINLSLFGILWLIYPAINLTGVARILVILSMVIFGAVLLFAALRERSLVGKDVERQSPAQIKSLITVDVIQWSAILISAAVMNAIGLSYLTAYVVMVIVGLHFFPFAKSFQEPVYYGTGFGITLLGILGAVASYGTEAPPIITCFVLTSAVLGLTVAYLLYSVRSNERLKS